MYKYTKFTYCLYEGQHVFTTRFHHLQQGFTTRIYNKDCHLEMSIVCLHSMQRPPFNLMKNHCTGRFLCVFWTHVTRPANLTWGDWVRVRNGAIFSKFYSKITYIKLVEIGAISLLWSLILDGAIAWVSLWMSKSYQVTYFSRCGWWYVVLRITGSHVDDHHWDVFLFTHLIVFLVFMS